MRGWVGNTGGTYGYATWIWYVLRSKASVIVFLRRDTSTFMPRHEVREQLVLQGLLTVWDVI